MPLLHIYSITAVWQPQTTWSLQLRYQFLASVWKNEQQHRVIIIIIIIIIISSSSSSITIIIIIITTIIQYFIMRVLTVWCGILFLLLIGLSVRQWL